MPPHRPPVLAPLSGGLLPNGVPCRRPVVSLPIELGVRRSRREFVPTPFLVDTGADITLIPLAIAKALAIVGYNDSAEFTTLRTSLHAVLKIKAGAVTIRVGRTVSSIPCYYYSAFFQHDSRYNGDDPFSRFFAKLLSWAPWSRKSDVSEYPIILGRAGVVGKYSLIMENNFVGISDNNQLDDVIKHFKPGCHDDYDI